MVERWAGPLMVSCVVKVKYTCITLLLTLYLLNLCNEFAHFEFGALGISKSKNPKYKLPRSCIEHG
jgi:hypothetical protein